MLFKILKGIWDTRDPTSRASFVSYLDDSSKYMYHYLGLNAKNATFELIYPNDVSNALI